METADWSSGADCEGSRDSCMTAVSRAFTQNAVETGFTGPSASSVV